ncbi:MAG: ATP-binding protein [Eubacteriales bacterium]|nr:ATP-binding protein [Eubacteriales bacterium]
MLYDIDFALAGLIFLFILYLFLTIQYNKLMPSIMQLRKLFLCLILADFTDILTAFTISYSQSVPLWINYILNMIFFELEVICISLFPKYIRSMLSDEQKNALIFDKINDIILFIYALICVSTPLTHSIFYFDENKEYQHGFLYLIIYILPLYFFVYSFVRLIVNKKSFNKRQFYSIIGFIIVATSGPALQMLLPGNRIIDFFALSIAAIIVVIGLETPDFLALEKTLAELETHKELLEKAKRKEEERSKVIHEMTKSASWSIHLDANHNITESFWSDEFFWLLGYEREELAGKEDTFWFDSLHPDEANSTLEAFGKGLQGIEQYDVIYRLRSKNGEYKWYRGTGELKSDPNAEGTVYHGIIQDVNDKIIKEDLIKEKTAALEELEKSQLALKEALQKAEAADKAKSDFLANMSHEIRTPINAVLGMNELIARESTEPTIQTYSANVADAGNALLSLINDILDFSKIEAGRMELAPADYELSVLLREVNNIIRVRCIDKGLNFIIQNNPDIPNHLYGDEVRLRQIIINLLNNALKYTDQGSVTLDANFETTQDGNITLIMSVTDTGIGIKEEDLPLLFESFKRIDLKQNRKREGTGLGLNITKSFVEMMHGVIEVHSVYGKGSTFLIRIPQVVTADTKIGVFDTSLNAPKKKKFEPSFTAPEARILVVDDVAINLKVMKGLLKQTAITVDTASSGQECLNAIVDTLYDIILLDHMMPEMDGIETMDCIHQDHTHVNQATPIIMLTANAIIGAKEEYLKMGFIDYLSKPVHPQELDAMLIKHLPKEKVIPNTHL